MALPREIVAGRRNAFLEPPLAVDSVRNQPAAALQRLAHRRDAGDILLLHDGHAAITSSGQPLALEILPTLLEQLRQQD